MLDSYWTQEPAHAQSYPADAVGNLNSQYDFANISGDLFQPEEIFQLDQPLRPEYTQHNSNDLSRSPSTLLDLGSGTIHREFKSEDYWNQSLSTIMNDDSNNSSCSRYNLASSPDTAQASLHNNALPIESQSDMNYNLQKYDKNQQIGYFEHGSYEESYKNQMTFLDVVGDTKTFFSEENIQNNFENFPETKQMYKGCNSDSKYQEKYTELSQYVDYSSLLYDNKNFTSDNVMMMNDTDFRVGTYLPISGVHYGPDFSVLNTMSHHGNI